MPVRADVEADDFVFGCVVSAAGRPVQGAVLRSGGVDLAWTVMDGRFAFPFEAATGSVEVLFGDRVAGSFERKPGETLVRVAGRHESIRGDPDGPPFVFVVGGDRQPVAGASVVLREDDGTTHRSAPSDLDGTAPIPAGADLSAVTSGRIAIPGTNTREFGTAYRRGMMVFATNAGSPPRPVVTLELPFRGPWRHSYVTRDWCGSGSGSTRLIAHRQWTEGLPVGSAWVVGDRWAALRRVDDGPVQFDDVRHAVTLSGPLPGPVADAGFQLFGVFPGARTLRQIEIPGFDQRPAPLVRLLDREDEPEIVVDTGPFGAPVTYSCTSSDHDRTALFWHPELSRPRSRGAPLTEQWGPILHTGTASIRFSLVGPATLSAAVSVQRIGGTFLRTIEVHGGQEVVLEDLAAGAFVVRHPTFGPDGTKLESHTAFTIVLGAGKSRSITLGGE